MAFYDHLIQLYTALGSFLYLGAVAAALALGTLHFQHSPEHYRETQWRERRTLWAIGGGFILAAGALLLGSPSPLLAISAMMAVTIGLQCLAAGISLPAALWLSGQPGRPPRGAQWAAPALAGGAVALISAGLGVALGLRPSPEAELAMSPEGWRAPGLLLLVILAAPVEEILFRGTLQGRMEVELRRRGFSEGWAILASALLWTGGHAGMVEPAGFKELQIFLLGLLFGWMRPRYGLAACVVMHLALNATVAGLQAVLWLRGAG